MLKRNGVALRGIALLLPLSATVQKRFHLPWYSAWGRSTVLDSLREVF